ncbi:MAG: 30S ribosome-binding factor RbfA [Gemmatimonadales bacterium]
MRDRGAGGAGRRPEQVAELVRQVVAEALTREVRDPRIGPVTLTRVEVSGDLSHARISVAVHAEEEGDETARRTLEGLRSAAGFLRGRVARALATRTTPELHFEIDEGFRHAARINAMLTELRQAEQGKE